MPLARPQNTTGGDHREGQPPPRLSPIGGCPPPPTRRRLSPLIRAVHDATHRRAPKPHLSRPNLLEVDGGRRTERRGQAAGAQPADEGGRSLRGITSALTLAGLSSGPSSVVTVAHDSQDRNGESSVPARRRTEARNPGRGDLTRDWRARSPGVADRIAPSAAAGTGPGTEGQRRRKERGAPETQGQPTQRKRPKNNEKEYEAGLR
jgi:hypothetical protein